MAIAVNEFFLDKIVKLKSSNNDENSDDATKELESFLNDKNIPNEGFELKELSDEEVSKLVKKMKGKKSCGLDWICGYSLKIVAKDLIPELGELINITFRRGSFTPQWKISKILPAFKNKGNRFDLKYYRPLSNLPEVSKLAEKAAHEQLFTYVSDITFKAVLNGMFISKLIYGITIYGAVWGLQGILNDEPVNSTSISKEDMRVLQVLQNKALRLLLRKPRETPVINLLKESNQMSVHQLVAYHTANQTFKVFRNQEPSYHYQRLFGDDVNQQSTRAATHLEGRVEFNRSLGRYSFFYQASHIWRNLPYHIKTAQTVENFKKALKPWILRTISMKP